MGLQERTAQKRIARALEKLRTFFAKRGVVSTGVIIAGAISANSIQAAPVALAKSVTAVAIVKGAAASTSTLTLIKGALKLMAWTKTKTAAVVGAAVILAAGTTGLVIKHEHRRQTDSPMPGVVMDDGGSSKQRLQGQWTGSNTAHPGETCALNISGDQIEYRGAEPNDWLRGTFILNENTQPKQIDVTILEPAKGFILCIYQVKSDTITIAAGEHGSGQRPVDFTPSHQVDVLEFQRN